MKDLSKDIVNTIKKDSIRLRSKWEFRSRAIGLKVLILVFIIMSAISFALMWYLISQIDWDVYRHTEHSLLELILVAIPYVWIVASVVFLTISYRNIRHMEMGYRYKALNIILIALAVSMGLGAVLYASGMDEKLDAVFREHVPVYNEAVYTKEDMWSQPEQGLIAGEVERVDEGGFTLYDLDQKEWDISYDEDVQIRSRVDLKEGEQIKVIGERQEEDAFEAREIRPWEGRGEQGQRKGSTHGNDGGKQKGHKK